MDSIWRRRCEGATSLLMTSLFTAAATTVLRCLTWLRCGCLKNNITSALMQNSDPPRFALFCATMFAKTLHGASLVRHHGWSWHTYCCSRVTASCRATGTRKPRRRGVPTSTPPNPLFGNLAAHVTLSLTEQAFNDLNCNAWPTYGHRVCHKMHCAHMPTEVLPVCDFYCSDCTHDVGSYKMPVCRPSNIRSQGRSRWAGCCLQRMCHSWGTLASC